LPHQTQSPPVHAVADANPAELRGVGWLGVGWLGVGLGPRRAANPRHGGTGATGCLRVPCLGDLGPPQGHPRAIPGWLWVFIYLFLFNLF
jgi:hypothetical protein